MSKQRSREKLPVDDSPRRNSRFELERAIQRYQDLYEFAPIPYVSFDRVGRIEEVNLVATLFLGHPRKRLIGRPFNLFVVREDTQLFLDHVSRCRLSAGSGERGVATELRVKNSRREIFNVQLSSNPVITSMGNGAVLFQTAMIDLTERKRAEDALRRSVEFDKAVMQNLGEGLYTIDAQGRLLTMNPAAEKILGWKLNELRGRRIHEAIHYKHRDGSPFPARDCPGLQVLLRETTVQNQEDAFIRKDGTFFDVVYSSAPIRRDGEVVGLVVVFHDVTETKRATLELADAARRQAVLYDLVRRRHEAKSADDIHTIAIDAILTGLNCDRASILFFDNKGTMRFAASRGLSDGYQAAVEGHSPWAPETKDPTPICISDLRSAKLPARLKSTIKREGISALAFVPLMLGQKLIGKFMAYYDQPHAFTQPEIDVASAVGSQLVLGLEHKRAEAALRQTEERFQLLVEGAQDYAMFLLNPENVITFWSAGAERLFGWTRGEAEGNSGDLIFIPEDKAKGAVEIEITTALRDGRAPDQRWHMRKDGSRFWTDGVMMRLDHENGELRGLAKIARDATEDRRSREELEERVKERTAALTFTNEKLQAEMEKRARLEQEILLISEREKRRIGEELHDTLCQELAASAFLLKSHAEKLGKRQPKVSDALLEAAQVVNANVGLARDLARGLHAIELSSVGLEGALRDLCYRLGQTGKIECHFECSRQLRLRDDAISLNLYRIAQEAVNNALKHAKPRNVSISLRRTRSALVLRVRDDGKGFTPGRDGKGMGLEIMQHRANVIGGQLSLESGLRAGTTITCTLPGE